MIVKASNPSWGVLSTSGYVIPGKTNGLGTIETYWFSRNFLTWQPQIIETTETQPQWLSFAAVPPLDYELQTVLYTQDGQKISQIINTFPRGPHYNQIRTDFTFLWKSHCISNNLEPLCYDVYGMGISPINITTRIKNHPFPQRYVLRAERFNDICFGFENTLGGFDTLMLEGKRTYQPEGDITTFKTLTTEKELFNDYTSIWEAWTGRIETERAAFQFQDFLKSTNRYVFTQGVWRRIIVNNYKLKHTHGESNSYSFKYHLADKNEGHYFNRSELPEPERQ